MPGTGLRAIAGFAGLAGLAAGCGDPAASEGQPPPEPPGASAIAEDPPPPPPEPGAFELPGLREHAPRKRFGWPVESVHLTSSYGWRTDPVTGRGTRLHRGIDLRGAVGDLVLSIGAGRVELVGHDPLLGNLVIVDHGEGLRSLYGHLSDVLVVSDAPVDRGAAIGLVGNTGRSAATHLHLTVTLDGEAIDPLEILGEPLHRPAALVGGAVGPALAPGTETETKTEVDGGPAAAEPDPAPAHAVTGSARLPPHPLPHRSDDGGSP